MGNKPTTEEYLKIFSEVGQDCVDGKPLPSAKISTLEKDRFYTLKMEADKIRERRSKKNTR